MRYQENTKILLSEDSTNQPKNIRFQQEIEDIDALSAKDSITRQEKFPIGTHSVSMGNITLGQLLIIKPTKELSVKINGAATPLILKGGKLSKMWMQITSLEISTAEEQDILIVIAGE